MKLFDLKNFLILGLLVVVMNATAQYQFESKKIEKQYYKFDDAYMDYDFDKILDMESEMLGYFAGKEDTVLANVYSFLGEAYFYMDGGVQKSIDYYEKEYELRLRVQPDQPKSELAYNLASTYDMVGYYDKSEQLYLDLIDADRATSGRKSEDYVLTVQSLADHYSLTGEADKGLKLIRQNKRSVDKGSFSEALMMKYEGDFLDIKGQYSKAKDVLLESLEMMTDLGYNPSLEYVYTLNSLGTVFTDMGDLSSAEKALNQAMNIMERLDPEEQEGMAGTLFNLASVKYELGFYEEALEDLSVVLEQEIDYYGEESFDVAQTLFTEGEVKRLKKDFFAAEESLLKAKEIFEALGEEESYEYSKILTTIGRLYTDLAMFDEAEEYTKQAIDLKAALSGEESMEYAISVSNLAELYVRSGQYDKAEDYGLQAVDLYKKSIGTKSTRYPLATKRMAALYWQQDKLDEALSFYQETFDNYFAQINAFFPILSEEEKSKFYYNKLKPTFEQFNAFVVGNRTEDAALIGQMYDYQLATKGLIFYATNKVRESILKSGDSALIQKYETWIGQKETLAQLFSAGDLTPEERNSKIDSLNESANQLEKELSEASAVFASNFASQDIKWQDVRDQLEPGEAAVEIIRFKDFDPEDGGRFTEEAYYVALIVKHDTQDAPEMVIMRNGLQMETKYLSNYRNAIKYQMNEVYSYRLFWRPLDNKLQGIKTIYFSPDGVYNQISIYTLQNPATKQFTIDEFEFQLMTNTKDLVTGVNTAITSDGDSFLFGYPDYNLGGQAEETEEGGNEQRGIGRGLSRGARGGEQGKLDDLTKASLPRGIRGNLLRYMGSGAGMPLLPGTQKEVNLIDSLYAVQSVKTNKIMDINAVEDKIKEVVNPKTLHIATHGFFLEHEEGSIENEDKHVSNPLMRSGLIMAGANSYIRDGAIETDVELNDDGILTAYEAMNLNLDQTELVVLSACETGLGEVKNGEGVFGLQRAFKVAGADAIIMSMWTVDDAATQELMTIFYEEWLSGKSKKDAFNMAQKRLKDKWKKPYYWGAFVMVGG
jgi:CHAT domain-containing protein/lipopolysaccharide biosynthesis regulator YciM